MAVISIEISYKTAPASDLEQVISTGNQIGCLVLNLPGVYESMVLSTCNRIEIYLSTSSAIDSADEALAILGKEADLPLPKMLEIAVVRRDREVIEHLLAVTCGLESMALGEAHIVSQVRESLARAQNEQTLGPQLAFLVGSALRTSKRARTQTSISTAGISLVEGGLEHARKEFGSLTGRTALVVGTGTMGSLAGRSLLREGADVLVSSRTMVNAKKMVTSIGGGRVIPAEAIGAALSDADLVVTATAAKEPVITKELLSVARDIGKQQALILLDLAMPRDVDPRCSELPGVEVIDLEQLGEVLTEGQGDISAVHAVRQLVTTDTETILIREGQKAGDPLICALRARIRAEAADELERLFRRTPSLDGLQREATEAALYRLVGKFLHGPTVRTHQMLGTADHSAYLNAFATIFDLSSDRTRV